MEKQKLIFLLMAVLVVASGKEWVPYAVVDSTQAVNTYPFNLVEGDKISFTVASTSQYYNNSHKVGCFLMKDREILQNSTFKTPGSIVSEPFSINEGQNGKYKIFIVSQNRWPIEYNITVLVNQIKVLEQSSVSAESL